MQQVKFRLVNPGLAPRRTKLEMPGWASGDDLMWPPFRSFGQDYYTYQLLLEVPELSCDRRHCGIRSGAVKPRTANW